MKPQSESRAPSGVHPGLILTVACIAQFMVILDVSVVLVAMPTIGSALHFPEADLQWIVSAYTVTFAGFLLLGGRAGDLLGRRRMFLVGIALFSLASLLGAMANNDGLLIGARALQGFGAAIVAPATLAIIMTTFAEGQKRNRALGIWGMMAAVGGSSGVFLGGILIDGLGWRWIFLINVPIGVALMVGAWRVIGRDRELRHHQTFDFAGALTITLGLIAIVFGIVSIDQHGWTSQQVLGGLLGGLIFVAVFVVIESRWAREPLIPMSLFSSGTLAGANVVMVLIGASMFGIWFLLSLYLQQVLGLSPLEAGVGFLPMTAMLALVSANTPKVIARFGTRNTLAIGLALIAISAAMFTQISADGSYAVDALAPMVFAAIGLGLAGVTATIAAVAGVSAHDAGLASGLVNTSRQMGGAVGLAILTTVAALLTRGYVVDHPGAGALSPEALTYGYRGAFVLAVVFAVFALIANLTLLRKAPAPVAPPLPSEL